MIRVLAFDVMDTLLRDPFREALQAATGLELAELFVRRDPELYPAFERGEVSEATYWQGYAPRGITADADAFHRVRRAGTHWLPGMEALVAELAGRVRLVTASNYPVWIEELAQGILAGRFEAVLASHHLGVRKPEPAFYTALLERIGAEAGEVAFVDDREANVTGAREVGLAAHHFTDAEGLRAWLVAEGVLTDG